MAQSAWLLDGVGSGWSEMNLPSVAGSELLDVACLEASQCTAVGTQGGSEQALAERWNGTEWTTQTAPNPAGASQVMLESVACVSASDCRAVGRYRTAAVAINTLVEAWNGTSWSIETVPKPAGAGWAWLEEISCASASFCMAVGIYYDAAEVRHPLIEYWNGTKWQLQTAPEPAGATSTTLLGVSCLSSANCTAVGGYSQSAPGVPSTYVVHWNGSSWSIQASPNVEKASLNSLMGVTCINSKKCVAVGLSENSEARSPLVLGWDGTTWSIETAPRPPQGKYTQLHDISCRNAADCVGVGSAAGGGRTSEVILKSVEAHQESGQATVLEAGEGPPTLSAANIETAQTLVESDASVQAAMKGAGYSLNVAPWVERTAEGKTVLIGAMAMVELSSAKSWEEWWSWPAIGYGAAQYISGTYSSGVLPASATKVDTMLVNLNAELDKSGNFIGGEVVQLMPVEDLGRGEVTVKPSVAENHNPEMQGY